MSRRAGRILAFGLTVAVGAAMPAWAHGTTERVSVSSGGAQGNGLSFHPVLSAGGRFVAFWSEATNLVPGDTNGQADVFVHDRQTGTTRRVSVVGRRQGNGISSTRRSRRTGASSPSSRSHEPGAGRHQRRHRCLRPRPRDRDDRAGERRAGGRQGNDDAAAALCWLSADGRFVAFTRTPTNLVPGDTNGMCRTSSSTTVRRARPPR